tara:strand:- start:132 stop:731 length:600 start_codon:yes stop_codon:yes gene_type:complete
MIYNASARPFPTALARHLVFAKPILRTLCLSLKKPAEPATDDYFLVFLKQNKPDWLYYLLVHVGLNNKNGTAFPDHKLGGYDLNWQSVSDAANWVDELLQSMPFRDVRCWLAKHLNITVPKVYENGTPINDTFQIFQWMVFAEGNYHAFMDALADLIRTSLADDSIVMANEETAKYQMKPYGVISIELDDLCNESPSDS